MTGDELLAREPSDGEALDVEAFKDPWSVIMRALECQSRGEELAADLAEAVEMAATLLAAKVLVAAGGDVDAVVRQFDERDHTFHLSYTPATEQVTIEVKWDDGETSVYVADAEPC